MTTFLFKTIMIVYKKFYVICFLCFLWGKSLMRNKKIIYRLIVLIGILILPIIVSKPVAAIVDLSNDGVIYSNYMQTKGYLP